MKVFVTALVILLVFVLVLVSVPGVRAAIQRWIGYVPQVGLVSEGQVRMLAEPVSVTREGVTLTLEEMWSASDRTFLRYKVEGRTPEMQDASSPGNGCLEPVTLRLPDRELKLSQPQAVNNWKTGYELKSIFPAIPSTIDEVSFVMPCVVLALPGKAPENWEVPLHLVPAPSNTVFPVIEISTPVAATPTALSETNTGLVTSGISLVLDRAVQMDDGYLLYVSIHWENTGLSWIDIPAPDTLHLLDASGQKVPYDLDLDATNAVQVTAAPGQNAFAIKTAPIPNAGPLKLTLDSASASVAVPENTNFTFDPGPDPKPGQVWELNQDLDVGHGHSLRVSRVTYNLTDGTQAWLSFEMESKTGITYASLFDRAHPKTGTAGGGGGGSFTPGPFTSDLYYLEPLPKGPLTVDITGISVNLPGPWQAEWTPPRP